MNSLTSATRWASDGSVSATQNAYVDKAAFLWGLRGTEAEKIGPRESGFVRSLG